MSPGNSYFKDKEVHYLLKTIVERFGRVAILIADVPAISTYIALGYPENRARRDKAIPKGNALKNRVRKIMADLGYSDDIVKIIDWGKQVENNPNYQQQYKKISNLYKINTGFQKIANQTAKAVLSGSQRKIDDINKAVQIAVRYLFSELAFLEFAPVFLRVEKVVYVYHRNWQIYEDYIAGKFDQVNKPYLDFLLVENPYETYNPIWGLEGDGVDDSFRDVLERVETGGVLRVGFFDYPTVLMRDSNNNFSGIFYEIIMTIAEKYKWKVKWVEETGYGVIIDGLNSNRFDVFGSTVWPTPERLLEAGFSIMLYQSPVFTWVRSNYGKTEEEIKQDNNIRVVVKENDISDSIAKSDFPNNRKTMVPQLSNVTEILQFVVDNRADFTFVEPYLAKHFNKSSKFNLVPASEKPIKVFDNTFMFKKDEKRLKSLLDAEIKLLKQDGVIDKLIKKYTGSEEFDIISEV